MAKKKKVADKKKLDELLNSLLIETKKLGINEYFVFNKVNFDYQNYGINPIKKIVMNSIFQKRFQWLDMVDVKIKNLFIVSEDYPFIKFLLNYDIYKQLLIENNTSFESNRNYYFCLSILNIYNNSTLQDLEKIFSIHDIPSIKMTIKFLNLLHDRLPLSCQHIDCDSNCEANLTDALLMAIFLPEEVRGHYVFEMPGFAIEDVEEYKSEVVSYNELKNKAEIAINNLLKTSIIKFNRLIDILETTPDEDFRIKYPVLNEFCEIENNKLIWKTRGKDNVSIINKEFFWYLYLNYIQHYNESDVNYLKEYFTLFGLINLNLVSKKKEFSKFAYDNKDAIFHNVENTTHINKYRQFHNELKLFLVKYYEPKDIVRKIINLPDK